MICCACKAMDGARAGLMAEYRKSPRPSPTHRQSPIGPSAHHRKQSMKTLIALILSLFATFASAQGFDHGYAAWDSLVKKHVKWLPDNKQSRVDYAGFAKDRAELKKVLDAMSAMPKAEFDGWSKDQRMAFLINAYNAFTVEVILTKYPDIKSIKELGSFNRGPWKNEFFTLLGEKHHLDWIEHEELRPKYGDPRVHAAVNCASIGCPALRNEAFTAAKLDAQLEDGMMRFLGDRTRNRVADGKLQVNAIFKWFKEDFEKGQKGFSKVEDVFAKYAAQLTDKPEEQAAIKAKSLPVAHLEYDWSLNAAGR
jgi:Skp family chaperone for outer membrane proteins